MFSKLFVNVIEYIVKKKGISQTAIAEKLGVSKSQVSHWKKGADIPYDRQKELDDIAELFSSDAEWAIHCENNSENEDKWYNYIKELLSYLEEEIPVPESCYDFDIFVPSIVAILNKIGAGIETQPPELDEEDDIDSLSLLILDILRISCPYSYWCESVFHNLPDEAWEHTMEIECYALEFAIAELAESLLKNKTFNKEILANYKEKTRPAIRSLIHQLLAELKRLKHPIDEDFFEILDTEVYALDDLASGKRYDQGIFGYLTIGERMLYVEQQETNRLLRVLIEKQGA